MTGLSNRWSEAEMIYHEAYDLQEKLLADEPDNSRFASVLSAIVNGLAVLSTNTGKLEDGERFFREALRIKKQLVERDPDVHLQRLGLAHWNLGVLYLASKQFDLAEKQFLEETKIAEEHYDEAPEMFRFWIERDKFCLSLINMSRGMLPEAMILIDDAIEMCKVRISLGAPVLNLWLAELLNTSAQIRMRTGEYEKAEEALLEALQIFRDSEPLASRSQGVFASFLNQYAILLWRTDRLSDAKKLVDEAFDISKEKAGEAPEAYNGLKSNVLCNLAIFLADNNELEAAEPHFQESLSIVEYLAKRTPAQFTDHLALVLHNYSHFHHKAVHKKEAKLLLERAIEIKRGLVEKLPEVFGPSLELSLDNLGVMKGDVKKQLEWEEKFVMFEELP
jgi:tetratricopeptide (TPR) repeat protein